MESQGFLLAIAQIAVAARRIFRVGGSDAWCVSQSLDEAEQKRGAAARSLCYYIGDLTSPCLRLSGRFRRLGIVRSGRDRNFCSGANDMPGNRSARPGSFLNDFGADSENPCVKRPRSDSAR